MPAGPLIGVDPEQPGHVVQQEHQIAPEIMHCTGILEEAC
jgi:hypothetical protein